MKKIFYGILLASLISCAPIFAQEDISSSLNSVPNEVIVTYKAPSLNNPKGLRSSSAISEESNMGQSISVVKTTDEQTVAQLIQDLQNDPNVESVQPNFVYTLQMTDPNDTYFSNQRGLKNIGQSSGTSGADTKRTQAMDIYSGNSNQNNTGTIVAIIDDGIRYPHLDFSGQLRDGINCLDDIGSLIGNCLFGFDMFAGDKDPLPTGGDTHGTHVAGIVGAKMNNNIGIAGINPGVKLMGVKAASAGSLSSLTVIRAIHFAKYNGAKIINASRGGTGSSCTNTYDTGLYEAIKDFPGLFITAAGNNATIHSNNFYNIPADYAFDTSCWSGLDNIISVAATNSLDQLASFSDRSASRVHIAAPGENIYSTMPGSSFDYKNGTSMATPFVVGAASLAWSMRPELSYLDIKQALLSQAQTLPSLSGKIIGGKRLDIFSTLNYLQISEISGLHIYTYSGKTLELLSGSYTSGNQVYAQWIAPSVTGTLVNYHIQLIYSGMTIISTGVQTLEFTLSLSGDGVYAFEVRPVFQGGATGSSAVSMFIVDTLAPSIPQVIAPNSGALIGYPGPTLSRTGSTDMGIGMSSGTYMYKIGGSGSANILISGTTNGSSVLVSSLTGNGDYRWQVQAIDSIGNISAWSQSGQFLLNIPQSFSFASQTNSELSTLATSDLILIQGLITGSHLEIIGGNCGLNSGAYTNVSGTVMSGDTLRIQQTSSASYSTTTTSSLTIGGYTGIFSVTTKAAPSGGGGGGGGGGGAGSISLATCTTAQLSCVDGTRAKKLGVSCENTKASTPCQTGTTTTTTGTTTTGSQVKLILFQTNTNYSAEFISAYQYAYKVGITTMPDMEKAQLEGGLIRKDLAKMIVNFAIKELGKVPDTGLNCIFDDMKNETTERQRYARLACQLGIMGHESNGNVAENFTPNSSVTRAQFATTLSRVLWGNMYNGGAIYYLNHLKALQKISIVKTINNADALEKRGYVMLMLMRSSEIK